MVDLRSLQERLSEFVRERAWEPRYLADAGLVDVDAEARSRLISEGTSLSKFYTLTWRELGNGFVATGQVSRREIDELIDAFDGPGCMAMSISMLSAWGRRPS